MIAVLYVTLSSPNLVKFGTDLPKIAQVGIWPLKPIFKNLLNNQ